MEFQLEKGTGAGSHDKKEEHIVDGIEPPSS